jgi:hypothetical protein
MSNESSDEVMRAFVQSALSSPVQPVMDANHISIPGPVQPEGDQPA